MFPLAGFTINRSTMNILVPQCSANKIKLVCYSYVTANLDNVVKFLDHLQSCINTLTTTHSLNKLALDEPEELTQASIATRIADSLQGYMERMDERLEASMNAHMRKIEEHLEAFEKRVDAKLDRCKKQMDEHLQTLTD